jgi:hypothetical protein
MIQEGGYPGGGGLSRRSNADEIAVSAEFMSAMLAALNESVEIAGDWNPDSIVSRGLAEATSPALPGTHLESSEIRFAALVNSCMAKLRSDTP